MICYYASPWWWAWPQTSWQCGQHFPVLASNSSHYHPADSVFDTNILLSHAICPSLFRYGLVQRRLRAKLSACIDYIIACAALLLWNLKPQKLILRAFLDVPRKFVPTKIIRHTVHPMWIDLSYLYLFNFFIYLNSGADIWTLL